MTTTDGRHGSRADELLSGWTEVAGRARRPAEAPTGPVVGGLGGLVRFAAPAAMAMVVVLAVGLLPVGRQEYSRMGVGASPGASPGLLDACPVTIPNGVRGGAWPETPLDHGADGIFTALAPDGTIEVPPDGSGVLWRYTLFSLADPAVGPLSVAMNPIGPGASPGLGYIGVTYPDGDSGEGVVRVSLGFPGEGCWEVVATAGPSELRLVTRVVSASDRWLDECQVTRPNEAHTDAWPASTLDIGAGGLFTVLWPEGTVVITRDDVDRDGIGWMKFVFQREGAAEGGLRLGGRRIGAEPSDPLGTVRSEIPDGYGTTGVQATAIGFPAEGCWEVIAMSGSSQLRFVTRVVFEPPVRVISSPAAASPAS
jgi:hypothetical protein